jgi:hypothetical protein
LRQLTGAEIARWLNVEFPQVQTTRADLLGITVDGGLIHIELQSSNELDMALRMAEYALRIYRQYQKFPTQIVLYVGENAMRMKHHWLEPNPVAPRFAFQYALVDIRDLDTAELLASSHIEDNLLAILTRLQDQLFTVREILGRIAGLEEPQRTAAFEQFLLISGLRQLAPTIKEESQKMPILNDILDHEVIGPAIMQGLAQGLAQGRAEGKMEGKAEGKAELVAKLMRTKFGSIPAWVEPSLKDLSPSDLDALFDRVVNASDFNQLSLRKP